MIHFSSSVSSLRASEIRDLMSLANKPDMILFSGGMPDNDLFPLEEVDAIYNRLSTKEKQIAMQYGPTHGIPPLLDSLSDYLKKKGLPVNDNKILITTGSLQAINILAHAFIDPGDIVLVENPCFIGAISAFRSYQANIVSIPLTPAGIDLEALEQTLDTLTTPPKMLYLTPNFHNPAGTLYHRDTKLKLIELMRNRSIPVLEDDAYSELYFHEEDKIHLETLKAMNPEGLDICYTGSFSKILGPGLRLGWMLVPEEIYKKCELIKQSIDACSPSFTQMIAHKFLESGMEQEYLKRIRPEYALRAETMSRLLRELLPEGCSFTEPRGGFYIWIKLPDSLDATDILKTAIAKGVVFVSGKTFDPHGIANNHIRLSYCNSSVAKINEGIPLVVDAIRHHQQQVVR